MRKVVELEEAAELLKQGGVVAFPTETVYGLGASIFLPQAIQRIFEVKGRPQDNPLIVHISDLEQLALIVQEIPKEFFLLAEAFFPGPLTVLLQKQSSVPDLVSAHLPTIGVRMPAHPIARQLIRKVGVPLVAPSANLSGRPSSTTAQHVLDDFGSAIEGVVDGGPAKVGIESTVITLKPKPLILRPGAITQSDLEVILKQPVEYATSNGAQPLSPGMKYRHYAPRACLTLFKDQEQLAHYLVRSPKVKRMILDSICPESLYMLLREADHRHVEEILLVCTPDMQQDRALMDRLTRAAQVNFLSS